MPGLAEPGPVRAWLPGTADRRVGRMDNQAEVRDFLATRRARLSPASLASESTATCSLNVATSVKCPTASPTPPPGAVGLDQAETGLNFKALELQDTPGTL
jgi:hypothetical protein